MARRSLLRSSGAEGRDAWISAALDMLGAHGVDGVRVERLARRMKITKGSFYHHFKNRDDLYAAMLEHWRRRVVIEVIERLESIPDPRERLRQVMRIPYDVARADRDVELAVMLWARSDKRAAKALEEADRMRADFIGRALVACGAPAAEGHARAVLALAFLRAAPSMDDAELAACEKLLIRP
jgi:AcrR family transcriptional regulator